MVSLEHEERYYRQVGQVRLRHSSEKVLPYHMITRQPIRWQKHDHFWLSSSAHFTFNPCLIRVEHVPKLFPCRDEKEAQEKFLKLDLATAQLIPGVFWHKGVDQSRRKSLGR